MRKSVRSNELEYVPRPARVRPSALHTRSGGGKPLRPAVAATDAVADTTEMSFVVTAPTKPGAPELIPEEFYACLSVENVSFVFERPGDFGFTQEHERNLASSRQPNLTSSPPQVITPSRACVIQRKLEATYAVGLRYSVAAEFERKLFTRSSEPRRADKASLYPPFVGEFRQRKLGRCLWPRSSFALRLSPWRTLARQQRAGRSLKTSEGASSSSAAMVSFATTLMQACG